MTDGMEFVIPQPVANQLTDSDLIRLTDESVRFWAESMDYWTLDQACALLAGFYPLDEWEDGFEVKSRLLHFHTNRIKQILSTEAAKNPQIRGDLRRPSEWIKMASEFDGLNIYAPIKTAIVGSNKADTKPTQKPSSLEIQAYVDEHYEDVWQSQHAAFMRGQRKAPTITSVAEVLAERINKTLGHDIEGDTVRRRYMKGKKPPKPE
jgi:hypothetical protein